MRIHHLQERHIRVVVRGIRPGRRRCGGHRHHQGAPGVAHSGVIAAILDEASGTVPTTVCFPAVTARLEVNYVAPHR
ncbi:hotdog domain-containing protein [Nocardia vinacea]|uniref:hotdog domain-containing protein n=1 Tax=Nocardia vinacea TaxID=96468 RepID=UPI0033F2E2DF